MSGIKFLPVRSDYDNIPVIGAYSSFTPICKGVDECLDLKYILDPKDHTLIACPVCRSHVVDNFYDPHVGMCWERNRLHSTHCITSMTQEKLDSWRLKVHDNLPKPAKIIRHAELKRAGESEYRSVCPECGEGLLMMRRNADMSLSPWDNCLSCGCKFQYIDIVVGSNVRELIYRTNHEIAAALIEQDKATG